MGRAKALRKKHLHGLRDEFVAPVAEQGLRLCIGKRNHALVVDQENRARSRLDDRPEALFAGTELRRELRRSGQIPDQLVAHRQYDDEERRQKDGGRMQHSGDDQCSDTGCCHDAQPKAAANECRAPACHGSAPPPETDGGIHDERDEQPIAELRDDCPRIRDADGADDDRASKELQMVQCRDLPEVHVDACQEIQRETGQPNSDHRVGEPEPARVEVQAHESHDGDHEHRERHMGPARVTGEVGRCRGIHSREFVSTVGRRRGREHEEQQIGVLRSLLLPDEQMDNAEHEARGDHHDPGNLQPVHLVTDKEGAVGAPSPSIPRLFR